MFVRIFNFIRGYIIITAAGFSGERFINLAARRSVLLWDIKREEGLLQVSVLAKEFRTLRSCAKKSGCKLRIIRKSGLPFILNGYKKRKFLIIGLLGFIALSAYLTSFIWLIQIFGNVDIETEILMAKLSELGVAPGESKAGLNMREIERELMVTFPEIVFVNLNVSGTRADLRIVEGVKPPEAEPVGIAADIVAEKDGIVVSIATELGRPMVQPGDVVKAGDVLVSGEVIVGNDEYGFSSYFVRASSRVMARRYYEYTFDVPLTYTIKSFTGNVSRNYGIILFDKKVYLENKESPYINYDKILSGNRLSFGPDYPLPVLWFEEKFREFIPVTVRRSQDEAEIMGRTIVDARILRELPEGTEIIDTEFNYKVLGGKMVIEAKVTAIEEISRVKEVKPPEPETQPEKNEVN